MNFLTSDKIAIYILLNYEKNIKKKRGDTEWCQPCIPLYFHLSELVQKFIQFNFLLFFVQTFINEVIWTNRSIVLGNETHKVKKSGCPLLKSNFHAVGMAVAQPLGFEIDFVRNSISGSAAWFFVIILKFIFTAIF